MASPRRTTPKSSVSSASVASEFDDNLICLGPGSYMLLCETDAQGRCSYKPDTGRVQHICLGKPFASSRIGILDTLRTTLICDPATNLLQAIGSPSGGQFRIVLFGKMWGQWVDHEGNRYPCGDPFELIHNLKMPVMLNPQSKELSFDLYINAYNREPFRESARRLLREERHRHHLSLTFSTPSGEFRHGEIVVEDKGASGQSLAYVVSEFPLKWPSEPVAGPAAPPVATSAPQQRPAVRSPRVSGEGKPGSRQAGETELQSASKRRPGKEQSAAPASRPSRTGPSRKEPRGKSEERDVAPTKQAPLAKRPARRRRVSREATDEAIRRSEKLPVSELVRVIGMVNNKDNQSSLIEHNLGMFRADRTYALIANFAEMIAEMSLKWTPPKLRRTFRQQPGTILLGIMQNWYVNQVLVVADDNPEEDKILDWLRSREIERLLKLNLTAKPKSLAEARLDLGIDRSADPRMIRKVWRIQLRFINSDLGRHNERAIHFKKDEIVKHLQAVRNLLLNYKPV